MIGEVATLFGDAGIGETAHSGNLLAMAPSDRRISRRVLDLWTQASRGLYPSWADLKETDLGEDGNWIFVVDLKESVGFPYFVYLGAALAKLSDVFLSGTNDWTLSLLDKATSTIDATVDRGVPVFEENRITLCDGRGLLFRSMTAPLADNGADISHVLGVVSGRLDN